MSENGTANGQEECKCKAVLEMLDDHDERIMGAELALKNIYRAFPSSDVEGHRRYHELIIENTAEKRRLRVAIQEKTISGLVWAAILFSCAAAWAAFKASLGIPK